MGAGNTLFKDKGLLALIALFIVLTPVLLTPWVHGHDGLGYYMILRSFWIDGDLDFTNEISRFQDRFPDLTFPKSEITGLPYTHYGVGNAILWTPFFAVAHGYVKFNHALGGGIPADGFSSPYITLVSFASAFYAFLGLVFLYLTLRQYFSLAANLTATLLIWFATPLLYYMYLSPTVSHANSFFSVTLFLFV